MSYWLIIVFNGVKPKHILSQGGTAVAQQVAWHSVMWLPRDQDIWNLIRTHADMVGAHRNIHYAVFVSWQLSWVLFFCQLVHLTSWQVNIVRVASWWNLLVDMIGAHRNIHYAVFFSWQLNWVLFFCQQVHLTSWQVNIVRVASWWHLLVGLCTE